MAVAKKKEEVMKIDESITETKVETIVDNTVTKYRCDFKSWDAYNQYNGKKG